MAFLNEEGLLKFYQLIDGKKANKGEIVKTASGISISTVSGLSATNVQEALEALKTAIGTGGTNSAVSVAKSNDAKGNTTFKISQGGNEVSNGSFTIPSLSDYVTKDTLDTMFNHDASSKAIDTFNEIVAFLAGVDNSDSKKTLKSFMDETNQKISDAESSAAAANTAANAAVKKVTAGTGLSAATQNGNVTITFNNDYKNQIDTILDSGILSPVVSSAGDVTFNIGYSGDKIVALDPGDFTGTKDEDGSVEITVNRYTLRGATATTAGSAGEVPAPKAGDQGKVLSGAGTWVDPTASIAAIDVDAWAKANNIS